MPRKSAEALAGEWFRRANAPPPPPPPEPPAYLSARAAEVWREIVKSKPPDYFDAANQHFLEMLCHHIATSNWVWSQIHELDPGDPKQFKRYRTLSVMAAREAKMTSLMLTKLRLLPTKQQAMAFA